jgi:hypothetical protein
MGKGKREKQDAKRLLGTYTLPSGQTAVGDLSLDGPKSLLRLHADDFLGRVEDGTCLTGVTYSGEYVSLIDCMSPGTGQTSIKGGPTKYHAEVFPHYVAVGHRHLVPSEACVMGVHFTTTDLKTLFYDFDAFGHVIDSKPIIDAVLEERRQTRPVEAGDWPRVCYFTGKDRIVAVDTVAGKISVNHGPSFNMGGPSGVSIKNRIVVSVEAESPMTFDVAMERMYEVCCFLSMAAGRSQAVRRIEITTNEIVDGIPQILRIHPSYQSKSTKVEHFKPHPGDVPLDPIREQAEFISVLTDWMKRHATWRAARGRYLGCLEKANQYDPERLVAAANMFDILPSSAFPESIPLDIELSKTRDECSRLLRRHPRSPDRDNALVALRKFGEPSLPKKVAHRTSMVEAKLGARFPDLQFVVNIAVKWRNYYVHGDSGSLNIDKIEPLTNFLTDALEFVFAASDLIEAGWDAVRWNSEPKGWGHSFARFRDAYDIGLMELRRATGRIQK